MTASAETSVSLQGELSLEEISAPKEEGNVPVSIVNDGVSIDVPKKERKGSIGRKDFEEKLKTASVTVNSKEDPNTTHVVTQDEIYRKEESKWDIRE